MNVRSIHLDDNGTVAYLDIRVTAEEAIRLPGILEQVKALRAAPSPAAPVAGRTVRESKPGRAPSRPKARAILLGLPDFEAVAGAELARRYGGSDSFWLYAKERVRVEIAALTVEAGKLRQANDTRSL
jgi:hypothetical protein